MEITQTRVTFRGGGCSPERAGAIVRLAMQYVGRMEMGQNEPRAPRALGNVAIPPLRLSIGSMSDDAVARAAASQIMRSLTTTAEPAGGGD